MSEMLSTVNIIKFMKFYECVEDLLNLVFGKMVHFCIKTIRSKNIKKERMLPIECLNVVQARECQ